MVVVFDRWSLNSNRGRALGLWRGHTA